MKNVELLLKRYNDLILEQQRALKKIQRVGNIYVALKLLFFSLLVFLIYSFFATELHIAFAIIPLVAYLTVHKLDSLRAAAESKIKAYIELYRVEIAYLNDDFSALDDGSSYINPKHNYSFDLDLFGANSLYAEISRSVSPSGADLLAEWLQNPLLCERSIKKRQEATAELSDKIDWTHKFRILAKIYPVGGYDKAYIEKWKLSNYDIYFKIKPLLFLINGLAAIALISAIFNFTPYSYFNAIVVVQLFVWILQMRFVGKTHLAIDSFVKNISNYFHLIEHLETEKFSSEELRDIETVLQGEICASEGFKELKRLKRTLDSRNNILGVLILNALYMFDVHTMISIARWHRRYLNHVEQWINAIDKIDALVSMANYKYNHPDFCTPQISSNAIISAKEMVHPLIKGESVVSNDIEVKNQHNIFIVTGANMSGKSTFLRGVGLNLLLALTGNVARCRSFEFKPISLFTSMRTSDNLSKGESYFHAELLRLKMLHENAANDKELFVILDEMLKGTNSEDKLNGSRKFLTRLLNLNVSGLVATHDLQLGELREKYPENFYNICFEIEHCNEDLVYSYKLQDGVSKNMNASFLLSKMDLL